MEKKEYEIEILDKISRSTHVKQRELSKVVGLSLGMTNAIIKRLIKKGLLKMKKINNRSIQYLISPSGMKAITKRSFIYFKRTVSDIILYRKNILSIIRNCSNEGYRAISLIGKSDIDFIIEHSCYTEGLQFKKEDSIGNNMDTFYLVTEQVEPDESKDIPKGVMYLQSILLSD